MNNYVQLWTRYCQYNTQINFMTNKTNSFAKITVLQQQLNPFYGHSENGLCQITSDEYRTKDNGPLNNLALVV